MPKALGVTWKTVTLDIAKRAVKAYNDDRWSDTDQNGQDVTRSNLDIDKEARSLFAEGLGRTHSEILRQLEFIGRGGSWGYGGVAGFQAALSLAPAIAADIHKGRTEYEHAASSAMPILHQIPNRDIIETLYPPFVKLLHGNSNWLVWATKFWHFLNPNAFPIKDGRVNKFFGVTKPNSVDAYLDFCEEFRRFALSHQGWLSELREIDGGNAWCDNKLWDKMCYSLPDLSGC